MADSSAGPDLAAVERQRAAMLGRLVELYRTLYQEGRFGPRMTYQERKPVADEIEAISAQYYALLPAVGVSVCPFCSAPLMQPLDIWGLDGLWWQARRGGPTNAASACEHLRLLSGAVGLNGLPPKGSPFSEAHPGPEVPFVYPYALAQEGMVAVVHALPMRNGYTAYPIAYYSPKRLEHPLMLPWWARTLATATAGPGGYGWTISTHEWAFDLKPLAQSGQVKWIDPESRQPVLSRRPPSEFPYGALPGLRMDQVITDGRRDLLPPPAGQPAAPFE